METEKKIEANLVVDLDRKLSTLLEKGSKDLFHELGTQDLYNLGFRLALFDHQVYRIEKHGFLTRVGDAALH